MRFWKKSLPADEPAPAGIEQRRAVRWCAACRSPIAPFVYFENGKHYCLRCSENVWATMGLRAAGKRDDDIQYPPHNNSPAA